MKGCKYHLRWSDECMHTNGHTDCRKDPLACELPNSPYATEISLKEMKVYVITSLLSDLQDAVKFRVPESKSLAVYREIKKHMEERGLPTDPRTTSINDGQMGDFAYAVEQALKENLASPQRRAAASDIIRKTVAEWCPVLEKFEKISSNP